MSSPGSRGTAGLDWTAAGRECEPLTCCSDEATLIVGLGSEADPSCLLLVRARPIADYQRLRQIVQNGSKSEYCASQDRSTDVRAREINAALVAP